MANGWAPFSPMYALIIIFYAKGYRRWEVAYTIMSPISRFAYQNEPEFGKDDMKADGIGRKDSKRPWVSEWMS